MSILPKVAGCASWSFLTVVLAVSGTVLIYFKHKKLSSLTKNSIEQTRQVLGLQRRQVDFGHEKNDYSSLTDGKVNQGQTIQVNNASPTPWSAANHQQYLTSVGAGDGQRDQLSAVRTPHSPRASETENEASLSSLVAEADGDREPQDTKTLVGDNSTLVHTSNLNEPRNKHEPVSSVENRRGEGKHDMKQEYQAERNDEQTGPQLKEEGGSRYGASGLPCGEAQRLGELEVVDRYAADEALCWIGSQHQLPNDTDTQMQVSLELSELGQGGSTIKATFPPSCPLTDVTGTVEDQGERERCIMPEISDTPREVALWRLAANRCVPTEAMIDMILKLAPPQEQ